MITPFRSFVALALVTLVAACLDQTPQGPDRVERPLFSHIPGHPSVRFSELHYDNSGVDAGEAIEISGPAGTDLTGWSVVLYNGSNGLSYGTTSLSGTIPATCTTRGVVVVNYPSNGIQNGAPDGMALVSPGGVVEFLSYEGTFTATDGLANGMLSTDIGVSETGTEPLGLSLSRAGSGIWSAPAANTFGSCNDDVEPPPPAPVDHVVVTPAEATIGVGAIQAFTATAYDDADQVIPGVAFAWSSSVPVVATVNGSGVASGLTPGDAQISATALGGAHASATLHVVTANLPATRFSEIHYDNTGTDVGEAIEIEGPAGTNLAGWSIVLYNGTGGAPYDTKVLSGVIADQCSGRGTLSFSYPSNGIQNGSPDGMALVSPGGVVEFLSYEGPFTAVGGPANGMGSTDIGVSEGGSDPIGRSLRRLSNGSWQPPALSSFGFCNGGAAPPPVAHFITISGRTAGDPALPVGFEDQLFATLRAPNGTAISTTITWASETPAIATIDQLGVIRALSPGTAIFRATSSDASATTATLSLPTIVATASATASYLGNTEFGEPADGSPADDFIVRYPYYTASYNPVRGTPNWVSYDLEATHFGPLDRCDCFTFDNTLPASFTRYTTADYTGAGTFAGYGIDRGHLARSFDRTSGSLDNAFTFYFTNIVPQASDNNQGPWAAFETYLGDLARFQNKEVYIIAGASGNKGTIKNEGKITIPTHTWKVALILPRNQGLGDIDDYRDPEVLAVIMPNVAGIKNVPWQTYLTTVDAVEQLSGYDLLALLPDQIEIAVESNTAPPVAVTDGPYTNRLVNEPIAMSGAGSSDPDLDPLTYGWDFGDGSSGAGVSVSHAYAAAGSYTVRLTVTDPLGLTNSVTTSAVVITPAQAGENALALVDQLEAGEKLSRGNANSLDAKLLAAIKAFQKGSPGAAVNQLHALLNELDALERSGRLSAADAAALRSLVNRIIASATS